MNELIKELAEQANWWKPLGLPSDWNEGDYVVSPEQMEKFAELIKQAIYDIVKEELIPDDIIAEETPQLQEYLKGCNGGTVDALCHIKNFGVDRDE
jgi:hypothetical protein